MTTATITQISQALKLTRAAIYKRAKLWTPVNKSGVALYDIEAISLDSKELTKVDRYLARTSCKIIPLHPDIDKAAEAAKKEQLRIEARAQGMELFPRLPLEKQQMASAKAELIAASERYILKHRLARTAGQNAFTHEFNMGRGDVPAWVRDHIRHIHAGTLRDWISTEYNLGLAGLVDCYGNRKDQGTIETWNAVTLKDGTVKAPMADNLAALILQYPHINEKKANEALRGLLPDAPYVSDKTVRRYMDKWKKNHAQQYAIACNPDDYKNRMQPAFGSRSEGIDGPNQLWEIDATPADLLLTDGRYKIIGVTDVGTARLKYYVNKTEKARDNAFAIRNCLLDWGVPAGGTIVTDQGSPYIGEHFTRVLHDLDIEQHICNAFSGDEKPHIERSFRTFSHDLIELTPGYCGHSVADRKELESRKSFAQRLMTRGEEIEISLSSGQLQTFIDRWTANYHNTVHSRLGKSPNQAVSEWPHAIYSIPDERALDILLAEAVRKGGRLPIIGKKGIRVNGGMYIHPALYNRIGESCRAFQDPSDLGRIIVHIMNDHGVWEFLCIAEDPKRTGISMAEVARATRHLHNEHKKEISRLNRELRKEIKGVDIVDKVMTYREKAAAEEQGNVTYFPRPSREYSSPGLTAAREAATALDGRTKRAEHPPELQAKRAALGAAVLAQQSAPAEAQPRPRVIPIKTPPPAGFCVPDDRRERWLLWNAIDQRIKEADETLLDAEIRFYTSFRNTPTWKSFNMLLAVSK